MFKSRYPISLYLLCFLPVAIIFITLWCSAHMFALLVYLPIGASLFYVFFCRYSCRIEVTEKAEMKITYFFPWQENVVVDLRQFSYLDYERSFYAFSLNHTIGYHSQLRICYDLLLFSTLKNEVQSELKVNIRSFEFKRLLHFLQQDLRLKLTKFEDGQSLIW